MKLKPMADKGDGDGGEDKDKEKGRALKCKGRDVQLESDRKQSSAKKLIISSSSAISGEREANCRLGERW
ncbi:hypothetical protein ACLKA6_005891 [Drosophila palustris]